MAAQVQNHNQLNPRLPRDWNRLPLAPMPRCTHRAVFFLPHPPCAPRNAASPGKLGPSFARSGAFLALVVVVHNRARQLAGRGRGVEYSPEHAMAWHGG